MKIILLRHGKTEYNREKRYQGTSDIPLSEEGRSELRPAGFFPDVLYVTPLCRTAKTAAILFPGAAPVAVDALREMDFGLFEGRNSREMENDAQYRAWVASGCRSRCPGGESLAAFEDRVCAAFSDLVDDAFQKEIHLLAVVAHGGTQMAVMERFAVPKQAYFTWIAPNGGGYVLQADPEIWKGSRQLTLTESVCYTQEKREKQEKKDGQC